MREGYSLKLNPIQHYNKGKMEANFKHRVKNYKQSKSLSDSVVYKKNDVS